MREEIRECILDFFQNNDNGEALGTMPWEVAKATIRGHLISIGAGQRKQSRAEENRLLSLIREAEEGLQSTSRPSADTIQQIQRLRAELRKHQIEHTERNLRFLGQRYYEKGERADRLLDYRLPVDRESRRVSGIRSSAGRFERDPVQISALFSDFYEKLYEQGPSLTPAHRRAYLERLDLPRLPREFQQALNYKITSDEIFLGGQIDVLWEGPWS